MTTAFLKRADLSHDGQVVAWSTLIEHEDRDEHEFAICSIDGSNVRRLPLAGVGAFQWSPIGAELAVVASVDGVNQLHVVTVDRGVRQLTSFRRGVSGDLAWSDDGREIVIAVRPDVVERTERRVDEVDGLGLVDEHVCDLYLVDAATGASVQLTSGPTIDGHPRFDGDRIAFVRSNEPSSSAPGETPLWTDRSGAVSPGGWPGTANCTVVPMGDGRIVLCASRRSDRTRGAAGTLFVLHPDGSLEDRTQDGDDHLLLSTLGDQPSTIEDPRRFVGIHGTDAIVGAPRRGRSLVLRIALSGPDRCDEVLAGDRGCHPLALCGDTLLFAESTMHGPPTLRAVDLGTGTEWTVVDPNPEWTSTLEVTELDVTSHGDPIDAWLLRRTDSAGPLPTVLIIHGGPYELFGHTLYRDTHLLTEAGFGVVMANPHGSIGYGATFSTTIFGRPGELETDDLLAAVDAAVSLGLADADRLGVCGLSYGGYMSAYLVGRTDRFRAAMIENPMTELVSMRDTSDIGPDLLDEMVGGTPDEVPDLYRSCSPLTYAASCRTPSLLLLGEQDRRCPPSQGQQFHHALQSAGCTTELVWLDEAAHADSSLGEHAVRKKQDSVLLDWMRRYLLD